MRATDCQKFPTVWRQAFGVGLLLVLVRVVDDQEVDGLAGGGAFDADADDAALVAEGLELVLLRGELRHGQAELGVGLDLVADGLAEGLGELEAVGDDRDAQVGVAVEQPQREPDAGAEALALLRGHGDLLALDFAAGDGGEAFVDEAECGGLDGGAVEGGGHLAGGGVGLGAELGGEASADLVDHEVVGGGGHRSPASRRD
ncbi:hypothetical protein [Nocardioides sp. SYSU DS0663]|uniref:hypothetical protein n=1 Tax=Nocardioides sp. SYSU DS0663 TaxID=3416445 RepID=UPI003F4B62D9